MSDKIIFSRKPTNSDASAMFENFVSGKASKHASCETTELWEIKPRKLCEQKDTFKCLVTQAVWSEELKWFVFFEFWA